MKKHMKFPKRIGIALCMTLYFCLSSCNYLNVTDYFTDTLSYDSIFQSKYNLQKYLWGTAVLFPDEGAVWGGNYTPGVVGSDETVVQWTESEFAGLAFTLGHITPDNLGTMNIWPNMYKVIRKTNNILTRIKECKDLSAAEEREIVGYAHFMRGYAYYLIFEYFGPVVLVGDDPMETNEEPEYYNKQRATFDESADYICEELEIAAQYMPLRVTNSQFGRPTKGAAYGLIARVRLQQASPMFNGGAAAKTTFGTWKRTTDGAYYVSQNYDEKKWAVAAHAAKRVIDMGIYELYTVKSDNFTNTPVLPTNTWDVNYNTKSFPDGALGIDPYRSYKDMFSGEAIATKNTEYLWATNSASTLNYTKHSFPVNNLGGWNGMAIPQKFIDAYYMVDGRDINNSSDEYPYSTEGFTSGKKDFSGYTLLDGTYNMYANREPRFYANIGFSGCFWPCLSTSEATKKNATVYYWKGATGSGASGKDMTDANVTNYTLTGYVTKKFIHPEDAWTGNEATRMPKTFPIMRYAEILLSYAEALNNLTTSHTITFEDGSTGTYTRDEAEIAKYFNMVRYRAGLPGLTTTQLNSAGETLDAIIKERMIEFFQENRRYFDVRRWGIYLEVDKEPITGMNMEAYKEDFFNEVIVNHTNVRNRVTDKKMVFLPISRTEIRKVPMMDQNPGY